MSSKIRSEEAKPQFWRGRKVFRRRSYGQFIQTAVKSAGLARSELLDCSLGTNPLGIQIPIEPGLADVQDYPDPEYTEFRQAVARFWSPVAPIVADMVIPGPGAIGVLERINKLFLAPGASVLGYGPQFTGYIDEVGAIGARYHAILLRAPDLVFDPQVMVTAVKEGNWNLVYIDNPNNPTGQVICLKDLEMVAKACWEADIPLVVDEAYGDYMSLDNSAAKLVCLYPNVIVVRSFSKAFCLAGLRVGYAIVSHELKDALQSVGPLFTVSTPGALLAVAVLERGHEFLQTCRRTICRFKQELLDSISPLGYVTPKTDNEVPIFVIGVSNSEVNLFEELLQLGVVSVPGHVFDGLGKNFARLRIPTDWSRLYDKLLQLRKRLIRIYSYTTL